MPLSDLTDESVGVQEVMGRDFDAVAEQVHLAKDPNSAVPIVEEYLRRKFERRSGDLKQDILATATGMIFQGRIASVKELESITGYNDKYLQRLFSERVGVGPKFLLKVARFQRSFQYLRSSASLIGTAYDSGYFDQAHFNRDFKFFTGTTPSAFLETPPSINHFFLDPGARSYLSGFSASGNPA